MRTVQLLLAFGLTSISSALDINMWYGNHCSGNSYNCNNINPNTCCHYMQYGGEGEILGDQGFPSVGVRAYPTNWRIELRGHRGSYCQAVFDRAYTDGRSPDMCMKLHPPYQGAGYSFVNRRRGAIARSPESAPCAAEDVEEVGCTASQTPDSVTFADGTSYDLRAMTQEQQNAIAEAFFAGEKEAPASFSLYVRK